MSNPWGVYQKNLYSCSLNAAGPGQGLDAETAELIEKIKKPTDIKVIVSLSCTMCPDTVVAAQHIAARSQSVTAEVYDYHHFEELQKRYNVMSVPCIVVNDSRVTFGKKNIKQLLDFINE